MMNDLRSKSNVVKCFCGYEMTRKDWKHQWVCHKCGRTKPIYECMTNADRIRSMTDEELAEWIGSLNACVSKDDEYCYKFKNCNDCRLEWLKSEVGCE